MISKKDVSQYIPKDKCLASWGGGDNYEFSFVPEAKQATTKSVAANAGEDEQFADRKVSDWAEQEILLDIPHQTTDKISNGVRMTKCPAVGVFSVTRHRPEEVGPWSSVA